MQAGLWDSNVTLNVLVKIHYMTNDIYACMTESESESEWEREREGKGVVFMAFPFMDYIFFIWRTYQGQFFRLYPEVIYYYRFTQASMNV